MNGRLFLYGLSKAPFGMLSRAIDERQLTPPPPWPPPGSRWMGPRGGRPEGLSAPTPHCEPGWGPLLSRAVGHQFTLSFCAEREAGTVAVFPDKL